ncbi:amidohydrolase [Anaerovorax odorimutans]|uniref:Amidohydrolase n=1 Tax=Anaerovorax odorimutans TaxID=109327 RepID=A0ABT1RNR3_9FIRM|nr:amidohydrolase [Anaerovorax odorimutans]MCQ4636832.1 amidohydrolase [Anaerovorax odorimutans]
MEKEKTFILDWVEKNKDQFYQIADQLWENPELGMEEYASSQALQELAKRNGFEVEAGVAEMPTAFIATWGQGSPVVGFSAEFDCLPGLSQDKDAVEKKPLVEGGPGHGCGHNLLGTGGIMAASALKEAMIEKGITGTIKVFGTPAEELCIGKPFMAKAGCFKGVDFFLDWHPMTMNRSGFAECSAYFNIKYHFKGNTAHGNAPWHGRSALDGALLMGSALEMLREHMPPGKVDAESTLNYSFPDVGTGFPNVVPDKSTIWVIGRLINADQVEALLPRVDACAEGAATATGTTVEKEVITVTHEKIPNEVISHVMYDNFKLVGPPQYSEDEIEAAKALQKACGAPETGMKMDLEPVEFRSMSVTDSSEYSWFAPMELALVELAPVGVGWHNWVVAKCAGGSMGKKAMTAAAKLLACTAADMLESPELIEQAKAELKERLAGRTYVPLFSEETKPACDINHEAMKPYR